MAFLQDVEGEETVNSSDIPCDLQQGDLVRLRMVDGSYTTFNKVPSDDVDPADWRPRGPKFKAGSSSLLVDTAFARGEWWVKVIVPGEGQGWIRRSYVQVIE